MFKLYAIIYNNLIWIKLTSFCEQKKDILRTILQQSYYTEIVLVRVE